MGPTPDGTSLPAAGALAARARTAGRAPKAADRARGPGVDRPPEPLRPIARLQTTRTVRHLLDSTWQVLAEVADDDVTGSLPDPSSGKTEGPRDPDAWPTAIAWREVEIELARGPAGLLDAAGRVLLDAGARPSPAASKLSLLLSAAGRPG